jgi:2-polyprenyl-6-methoxyphenol hydroxylase-like FAD-dependent oxidoreductase
MHPPGTRHAEIAGAGIAGLTTACALAQRGWSVRVHERTAELREMGAGIYLKVNAMIVLRELGVLEAVREVAPVVRRGHIAGRSGRILARRDQPAQQNDTVVILRARLHGILARRAIELGVSFLTNSAVVRAHPDGWIETSDGTRYRGDLVVGADGLRSAVRDSLRLLDRLSLLQEGAIRALVPRLPGEREGLTTEQWSGDCRLGIVPCSGDQLYLYLIGSMQEPRAMSVPIDKDFWKERFPQEKEVLDRISSETGRFDQLSYCTVRAWSVGRVAIIGDAVHAQPPNLGQGAGMAMANAIAMARALDDQPEVTAGLRQWEETRRPLTEQVQKWSYRYGFIFYALPVTGRVAEAARASLIWLIGHVRWSARKLGWLQRGGYHAGEVTL